MSNERISLRLSPVKISTQNALSTGDSVLFETNLQDISRYYMAQVTNMRVSASGGGIEDYVVDGTNIFYFNLLTQGSALSGFSVGPNSLGSDQGVAVAFKLVTGTTSNTTVAGHYKGEEVRYNTLFVIPPAPESGQFSLNRDKEWASYGVYSYVNEAGEIVSFQINNPGFGIFFDANISGVTSIYIETCNASKVAQAPTFFEVTPSYVYTMGGDVAGVIGEFTSELPETSPALVSTANKLAIAYASLYDAGSDSVRVYGTGLTTDSYSRLSGLRPAPGKSLSISRSNSSTIQDTAGYMGIKDPGRSTTTFSVPLSLITRKQVHELQKLELYNRYLFMSIFEKNKGDSHAVSYRRELDLSRYVRIGSIGDIEEVHEGFYNTTIVLEEV